MKASGGSHVFPRQPFALVPAESADLTALAEAVGDLSSRDVGTLDDWISERVRGPHGLGSLFQPDPERPAA